MSEGVGELTAALSVRDLSAELVQGGPVIEDVSFVVRRGQVLGLVGESGSGKTTTALAILGHARPGIRLVAGEVLVAGEPMLGRSPAALRRLRGRAVSYVPQDPATALNPSLRVGEQLADLARIHTPDGDVKAQVASVLDRVRLPSSESFTRRFPHQLSGGQQQRISIAAALVSDPDVVVLDEPTTGLDVVTQSFILAEIDRLRRELGLAVVYVTHDLAVVASIADRIAVMYAGRLVEEGAAADVLRTPRHPYGRGLVSSIPDHKVARRLVGIPGVVVGVEERGPGCAFAPRCDQRVADCTERMPELEPVGPGHRARCIEWRRTPPLAAVSPAPARDGRSGAAPLLAVRSLHAEHRSRREVVSAVRDVSFVVEHGRCVALVGESGSGKTTIARCVAGLHQPSAGQILLEDRPLVSRARDRTLDERRRIQIVFQNPNDSLNPRHRVVDAIARPARVLRGMSSAEAGREAASLLDRVRLPKRLAERFPSELSGGERQRVAIARALAAGPELIVCDEITSALDVSVQAAVLDLLSELRTGLRLGLLFISHDLGVVASVADEVVVLSKGEVCELGPVDDLLLNPQRQYTRELIEAAPSASMLTGSSELGIR